MMGSLIDYFMGALVGTVFGGLMVIAFIPPPIISDVSIKPEVTVTTVDGVSDTTYIYYHK